MNIWRSYLALSFTQQWSPLPYYDSLLLRTRNFDVNTLLKRNFVFAATFTVQFGTATATGLTVVGTHWIKGELPTSLDGPGLTSVTLTYGTTKLLMPDSFKYLPDLPAVQIQPPAVAA